MRLRLLYQAARLAMVARGLHTRSIALPPGEIVPELTFVDGRGLHAADGAEEVEAPLAVFVHGLGSSVATWSNVLPSLARVVPLVAPDLPGYGRTSLPEGAAFATMREQVDATCAFIDVISPDAPVQLVGQSMGGWIAARVAALRPDRVSRLTLINTAGVLTPQVFEQRRLFTPYDRNDLRRLWRRMWHELPLTFYLFEREYLELTRTPLVRGFLDSVQEDDFLNDHLPEIRAPTMLLWGLSDGLLDYGAVRILRESITDIRVRLLPDCGHVPQRERPDLFLQYVGPWLTGQEPPETERAPPPSTNGPAASRPAR